MAAPSSGWAHTGATSTVVNVAMLVAIGYDPALAANRVQVTTGSGVEFAPLVELKRLAALGQERFEFPALGHTLRQALESMDCWVWTFFEDCA